MSAYCNPILPGTNPDPSVCRVGEDYYLATSTFTYFPGVPIYHSRDLVHWRHVGHALTRTNQLNLTGVEFSRGIFAPTLRHHDGTFYMITTNVDGGGNFYVTATDPAGPWSDPIWVDEGYFDPDLFFDGGRVYYSRRQRNTIVQAEIDVGTGRLKEPLRTIATSMVGEGIEGPHVYRIGEWYYLLCAEGGTEMMHMATVARSRDATGPFEPCPHNPVLSQRVSSSARLYAAGHAEFVQDHRGGWWAFYLAKRSHDSAFLSHLGRETHLMPLEWHEGWPVVGQGGRPLLDVETSRRLPEHVWEAEPPRDDFDGDRRRLCWYTLGEPMADRIVLGRRPGHLRLHGAADTLDDARPTFLCRRQQHLACVARACVDFQPLREREEAGLALFTAPGYHIDFVVTWRDGARCVLLRLKSGDILRESIIPCAEGGPLELAVQASPTVYRFTVRDADAAEREAGSVRTRHLAVELAHVWTGVFVGLYASGRGETCATLCDVDWFDYEGA